MVSRQLCKPDAAGSKPHDGTFYIFFYMSIFVYFEYESYSLIFVYFENESYSLIFVYFEYESYSFKLLDLEHN